METFIARQPIFDATQRVCAYELLFRGGPENRYTGADGDLASASVINNSLFTFGLEKLSGNKKVFINITRRLLLSDTVLLLPRERAVIEILEEVKPDPQVLAACGRLKEAGYTLALDDFVFDPEYEELLPFADILKIDFRLTKNTERAARAQGLRARGLTLLAEKVETLDEVQEARAAGYSQFQGYFFCQPQMLKRQEIPGYKLNYLRFLHEVNRPDIDFDRLEQLMKQEVSLALRLLRLVNSAVFGLRHKVNSLGWALAFLGVDAMKQWASLLALTDMGSDKPDELVKTAMLRARFCERLGTPARIRGRQHDLFMLGMFSAIDVLVGRPLAELLAELPLAEDVNNALLGKPSPLREIYHLVLAYERGEWVQVAKLAAEMRLPEAEISASYGEAVAAAEQIFQSQVD